MLMRFVSFVILIALVVGVFASIPTQAAINEQISSTDVQVADRQQAATPAQAPTPSNAIRLQPIGTYVDPVGPAGYDDTGGLLEIVAYDSTSQRLFAVSAVAGSVDIIDISNPYEPTRINRIEGADLGGGEPNSVAVSNGLVGVAAAAGDVDANGTVYFFDTDGAAQGNATVGVLPDMVTFTPNGNYALTANEGEPNDDYTIDPEGSVSIIDTAGDNPSFNVTNVTFEAFNVGGSRIGEISTEPIRIFGPGATVAQDLEPEYITATDDTAYVIAQENNALIIIDIDAGTVSAMLGLGTKDHSAAANPLDASNRDGPDGEGAINIQNWPVMGMYQPDGFTSYEEGGQLYLVTANEGDARDYEGFTEEFRVGDLPLNADVFTDDTLQDDANLGRLRVTNTPGFLNEAQLRVAHASPDTPAVDIYVDDTLTLPNVGFFTASDYLTVPPGTYNVKVTLAGQPLGSAVFDQDFTLEPGGAYTVAATGFLAPPMGNTNALTLTTYIDNLGGTAPDTARVRAYHMSPDAPGVDVRVADGGPTLITNLEFPNGSDYLEVPEGTYDLEVVVTGTDNVVISLDDTELTAGWNYSVFAVDEVADIRAETSVFTFSRLYNYGARSFTIWNASTGAVVYDSEDDFGQIAAAEVPDFFNANFEDGDFSDGGDVFEFDARSDDKGGEPENVTVGTIDGNTYAFVILERQNGIMVYDITDPDTPSFVTYFNDTNFNGGIATNPEDANPVNAGNVSPEGIVFVPTSDSPTSRPLVVVSYELSGTIGIYEVFPGDEFISYLPFVSSGPDTLTLMHNNDGESTILPLTNSVEPGSGFPNTAEVDLLTSSVAAFDAVLEREIADARAQGNSVLTVYAGDAFLASATLQLTLGDPNAPVYDALAQSQMPYDAHTLGNHEFDYNPDFLQRFIEAFEVNGELTQPFLAANLDFSGEPGLQALVTNNPNRVLLDPVTDGRVIGSTAIITDEVTGIPFGIIGVSPFYLPSISSPRGVTVTTPDVTSTGQLIQQEADRLTNEYGIARIIVVSHLQDIEEDIGLAPTLSNVDAIVAGGGDELLVNSNLDEQMQLLPGEGSSISDNPYPTMVTGADGNRILIVTTAGNYKYVGRLDVQFNSSGNVVGYISEESYPRRVIPDTPDNASAIAALGVTDAVTPSPDIVSSVQVPVADGLEALDAQPVARSEITLDTSRAGARERESNTGNMVTDSYIYAYDQAAGAGAFPARGPGNQVIAIQNGGGIRQNAGDTLPVGDDIISVRNTFDVLAFFNTMTVVQDVTPTELKQVFERSGSRIGGGQFLQISGLTVEYDVSRTAQVIDSDAATITTPGDRVRSITLDDGTQIVVDGQVDAGAPNVSIVTNSFTAGGGDDYIMFENKPNRPQLLTADNQVLTYRQAWADYMLSFPASGTPSLPTITAALEGGAYAEGVNQRSIITGTTP